MPDALISSSDLTAHCHYLPHDLRGVALIPSRGSPPKKASYVTLREIGVREDFPSIPGCEEWRARNVLLKFV